MYQAYFSNGVIIEALSAKAIYHAAEHERKYWSAVLDCGMPGYELSNNRVIFFTVKAGKDVTMTEADVSIRLYNVFLRRALTDGLVSKGTRDLTMGQLYDFLTAGYLYRVRNAGTKTYLELFQMLHRYIGWDINLMEALITCTTWEIGMEWANKHIASYIRMK